MRLLLLILFAVGNVSAQTPSLTARQLYEDTAPPAKGGGAARAAKGSGAAKSAKGSGGVKDDGATKGATQTEVGRGSEQAGIISTPAINIVPVALHLGLRYNILKTDPATRVTQNVDSESNFKAGDCLQIQFRPNRDSYLYVFNSGSSGAWQPLLPSAQMPEEANHIRNGVVATVPEQFCLQLKDPKGVDTVLVVLTERQEDVYQLNQRIRKSVQDGGQRQPPASLGGNGETLAVLQPIADPRKEGGALVGRDIEIQKIGTPEAGDEPPNSVYAVNTSADPNEHVVIEVKIRHE